MRVEWAVPILACTVAAAASPVTFASASEKPEPARAKAVLELSQQFVYAGDPLMVRVSVGNDGASEIVNPVKTPLPAGFEARVVDGAELKPSTKSRGKESSRPERLSPNYSYSAIVDLVQIFPDLGKPGRYEIRWSADGVASAPVVVRTIPKYDASREYRARIDTDEGYFVIDLFGKSAPLATKAFVDMANSGFYDGLTIHKVVPDRLIEGGDSQGDGSGAPPFRYPADPSSIPVVAGTVLMKPSSPSPPTNGSQFIVMLRPEPTWTGQATVLGQVVEGMDVVQKISRLPSTQETAKPYYKPLKDVRIRRVTVTEKAAAPGAGAGGGGGDGDGRGGEFS